MRTKENTLTQDAFTQAAEVEVSRIEFVSPQVVHCYRLAVDQDVRTAIKYALRCTFHHQYIPKITGRFRIMNRHL